MTRFFLSALLFLAVPFATTVSAEKQQGRSTIARDPNLPNVLIIGDSISIGYTPFVRDELEGKANVRRPMLADKGKPENCGDSKMIIQSLERWIGDENWAVIHFNCGLWDISGRRELKDGNGIGGKHRVPLKQYGKNLDEIALRLEKTGAKLIWANTTFVPRGEPNRVRGDEETFNEAAAIVMKKRRIETNDLFSITRTFPPEYFLKPGDVHYKNAGSKKLGKRVAEVIEKHLSVREKATP